MSSIFSLFTAVQMFQLGAISIFEFKHRSDTSEICPSLRAPFVIFMYALLFVCLYLGLLSIPIFILLIMLLVIWLV